jgi:flagellar assembly protein FliH
MTSSSERLSPEQVFPEPGYRALSMPELRSGAWTRYGEAGVLGDEVTERALAGLAENARSAARAQGYAVGWAQGRQEAGREAQAQAARVAEEQRAAEERREVEHHARLATLEQTAARLSAAVAGICATLEAQASELAWELTRALVGHELRCAGEQAGADVVRRVLAVAPDEPATVRLHPGDVDAELRATLAGHGLRVVADATLATGDAVVETTEQVVDLRMDAALERLAAELAPQATGEQR